MIPSLAKSGVLVLSISAVSISLLGILLMGIIVFVVLLSVIFVLLAGILAVYYSLTKKPKLEREGNWEIDRVRGK